MPLQPRIATVVATGRRYFVQQIDFTTDTVHVWGEVVGYVSDSRGVRTKHRGALAFPISDVTIADTFKTERLANELLEQAQDAIDAGELPGYKPRPGSQVRRWAENHIQLTSLHACALCGRQRHRLNDVEGLAICDECRDEVAA